MANWMAQMARVMCLKQMISAHVSWRRRRRKQQIEKEPIFRVNNKQQQQQREKEVFKIQF